MEQALGTWHDRYGPESHTHTNMLLAERCGIVTSSEAVKLPPFYTETQSVGANSWKGDFGLLTGHWNGLHTFQVLNVM